MTRLWPDGEVIAVEDDAEGMPQRFLWRGRWRAVQAVTNRWRVRSNWWTPTADARREYFKVITEDGLLCAVYRDLRDDSWRLARLYD